MVVGGEVPTSKEHGKGGSPAAPSSAVRTAL
jgi:hypothetical protein